MLILNVNTDWLVMPFYQFDLLKEVLFYCFKLAGRGLLVTVFTLDL